MIKPHGSAHAAAEIRRLGHHPRIVQVLASHGAQRPYGDPFYHPIYEACAPRSAFRSRSISAARAGSTRIRSGQGRRPFFWETHALLPQSAMTHMASMIAHGVFEKWPGLYFVVIECGIAWVPSVLWRLDANFKALRKEMPWLKMLPSEVFLAQHPILDSARDAGHEDRASLGRPRSHGWPQHADVRVRLSVTGTTTISTVCTSRRTGGRTSSAATP